MLYTSVKVTVKNDTATINNQILLYRGDKNVEVQFEILESLYRQYKLEGPNTIENLSASYGQLIIKKPDSTFVPSAVVETKDGKVIFTIPAEMIDEESEVGEFSFQIILFDESRSSKVSLPPVVNGIVVKAPLTTDNNTNAVGTAEVGDAHVAVSYGVEDTFDVDGDYNKTNWVSGDLITSSNLNKIEDAIFTINDNLKNAEFPTQEGVATELYVDAAISALREELIALIGSGGVSNPVIDFDMVETGHINEEGVIKKSSWTTIGFTPVKAGVTYQIKGITKFFMLYDSAQVAITSSYSNEVLTNRIFTPEVNGFVRFSFNEDVSNNETYQSRDTLAIVVM